MPEPNESNRRDYSIFDKMSTEELKTILQDDSQLSENEDSDMDAILYIMEVISKREKEQPTQKYNDVHTAWASFCENYLPYVRDNKSLYDFGDVEKAGLKQKSFEKFSFLRRKRRLMRVACITAAVTVLMFAGTVTASTLGFDLWDTVAKWTSDTFGFSVAVSDSGESKQIGDEDDNSLQNTLDQYEITADLAPTWFPEGYSFESVDVAESPERITFHAIYKSGENEIFVSIALLSKPSTSTYEKDSEDVTVYKSDGIEHYIMTNIEHTQVVWKTENFECSISGRITLVEAKKIIDSIYERA